MVVGCGVTDDDRLPLSLEDDGQFPYLGSLIAESGRSHEEVDRRIAKWAIEMRCFLRLQFVGEDQEECVQCLCDVSSVVWQQVLGTTLRDLKIFNSGPPQMHAHSIGHHQPEAVGGAHLYSSCERE